MKTIIASECKRSTYCSSETGANPILSNDGLLDAAVLDGGGGCIRAVDVSGNIRRRIRFRVMLMRN